MTPKRAKNSITDEARKIGLLFQFGALPAKDVIAWADSKIVEMDSPSETLFELSTTAPDKTADFVSCLARLGLGADFCTALRSAISHL